MYQTTSNWYASGSYCLQIFFKTVASKDWREFIVLFSSFYDVPMYLFYISSHLSSFSYVFVLVTFCLYVMYMYLFLTISLYYCPLFNLQFRVLIWRPIWLEVWKKVPNSPCLCLPLLIILYQLMCTIWDQPRLLQGLLRVNKIKNITTRGHPRLIVVQGQTRRSARIIREKCTIQSFYMVSTSGQVIRASPIGQP